GPPTAEPPQPGGTAQVTPRGGQRRSSSRQDLDPHWPLQSIVVALDRRAHRARGVLHAIRTEPTLDAGGGHARRGGGRRRLSDLERLWLEDDSRAAEPIVKAGKSIRPARW